MSDKMSIDKKEHSKDESEESIGSSPENEIGPSIPTENQPAKRKGGRKPVSLFMHGVIIPLVYFIGF